MTDESKPIEALHAEYCRLTGMPVALNMNRIYWWSIWRGRGNTIEDLRLVVEYLKNEMAQKPPRRWPGALKFSNLIVNEDRWEEDLNLARCWKRAQKPKSDAKARVLAAREQRVDAVDIPACTVTAKPIGDLIPKLLQQMRDAAK